MATFHHLPWFQTDLGVFAASEALTWTGSTGRYVADDSNSIDLWVLTGSVPGPDELITGSATGSRRRIGGSRYLLHYNVTNGIAFVGGEAIQWGGGASTGRFRENAYTDAITFYHDTGPAPAPGDTVSAPTGSGASRTLSAWGNWPLNTEIRPVRLPYIAADRNLTAIAYKVNVAETNSVATFRTIFTYFVDLLGGQSGFLSHFPNNFLKDSTEDFQAVSVGAFYAGQGFTFGSQFTPDELSGLLLQTDPDVYPRWIRAFVNIDGSGVSHPHVLVRESVGTGIVNVQVTKIGTITDPVGNLSKDYALADWQTMTGDYAVWRADVGLHGQPLSPVGMFYIDNSYMESLHPTSPTGTRYEWYSYYPSLTQPTLLDDRMDFRYYDLRVYDNVAGEWRFLTDWQVTNEAEGPDPNHGYSTQHDPGKIAALCGATTSHRENVRDRYLFAGFTYRNASTLAALAPVGMQQEVSGDRYLNGPKWGSATPWVMNESVRGYLVLHPSTTQGASAVFRVPDDAAGTYRIEGDFARANTASGSGDGVLVSVTAAGTVLFSGACTATATVNLNDVFNVSNASLQNFAGTAVLRAGDEIVFTVTSGGADSTFDATALRVTTLAFVEPVVVPALTERTFEVAERIQIGRWNTTLLTWTNGVGSISAGTECWTQWDMSAFDISNLFIGNAPDPTVHIGTTSGGRYILDFVAWLGPVVADFSTASPPTNRDFRKIVTKTVDIMMPSAGMTTVTLPLRNDDGTMTPLGASLMANYRRLDSQGRRRFTFGVRVNSTTPLTATGNPSPPSNHQMFDTDIDSFTVYVGDNFTGWGGVRGTPGVDRAVRCPRCGIVLREAELVADGVVRIKVCPDCYDPPVEPSNFRWPFRS